MAHSKQAKKRARQAEDARLRNASQRSTVRTAIKRVIAALRASDKTQAEAAYKAAVPVIDSMARKGIIAKNTAARHKSRLNTRIRNLAA